MIKQLREDILKTGANVFRLARYMDGEWREEILRPACPCLNCYSVSKNFTATAVGVAQDMGLLSIEDPIVKFFPDEMPPNPDDKLERVRIRHLLTHTMGNGGGYLFESDRYGHGVDDWARFILSKPLEYEPGVHFAYSNSTYYLLSCIIHRASGMTMDLFLRGYLFRHMGIDGFAWETCPMGETMGATGLYMSTRDVGKLGLLYLNEGEYEGRRLLSRRFAREAVKRQSEGVGGGGYGFSFGFFDLGFYGGGAYDQANIVVPGRMIVLAVHSFNETQIDLVGILRNRL